MEPLQTLIAKFATMSIGIGGMDTATYLRYKKAVNQCSDPEKLKKLALEIIDLVWQ